MIIKSSVLTVLGRRDKQQILKDVLRPPPASTISAPTISSGGGGGSGCTGGPAPGEGLYVAEDLVLNEDDRWVPATYEVDYYLRVYYDGTEVHIVSDYTVIDGAIVPTYALDPLTIVSAEFYRI